MFLINPSLTTDLFRFNRANPKKKNIMAIRIGGKVNTSRALDHLGLEGMLYLHCDDVSPTVDSLDRIKHPSVGPTRMANVSD